MGRMHFSISTYMYKSSCQKMHCKMFGRPTTYIVALVEWMDHCTAVRRVCWLVWSTPRKANSPVKCQRSSYLVIPHIFCKIVSCGLDRWFHRNQCDNLQFNSKSTINKGGRCSGTFNNMHIYKEGLPALGGSA